MSSIYFHISGDCSCEWPNFFLGHPHHWENTHIRARCRVRSFVPLTVHCGMTIMRECISCTPAPCRRAGIVLATSELATRDQERYKTLCRHQVLNDRHAGHGVARYMSSGDHHTACARALQPQWQLRHNYSGQTQRAEHGYSGG